MNTQHTSSRKSSLPVAAILVLALLSAVAPLATDMYLPGFPIIANDLQASAAAIQMTLTSFFIGLALGQLIIGPLSDRYGRRRPLLIGTGLAVLSGVLCVLAPNIETLIVFRLLQGLGGAAGIVLARAVIADATQSQSESARLFQIMMMIGGLAPILAPIVGTGIVAMGGWRTVFVVLALLSALALVGVVRFVDESLAPSRRIAGSGKALWLQALQLLRNRSYWGYTLTVGFSFMLMFGYIAASPFVFQNILGLSAAQYSIAFGGNALGVVVIGAVGAKLVGKVAPRRLVVYGLVTGVVGAAATLLCVLLHVGAPWLLLAIFLALASMGLIMGNASALAIAQAPQSAGTASALLGAVQFCLGAFAAPLVGLRGDGSALPMSIVMLLAAVLATVAFFGLPRVQHHRETR